MRPDEHKRKVSSQYKKKHGMDNNTTADTGKNSRKRDKKSKLPNESGTSSEQNLNVDSTLNESVNYSKRKVESNWDKYDEIDDVEGRIGADFHELLSSAGGASSHMMLESEKKWENIEELDEMISIDFQQLAKSLGNLSFCDRLGLDENDFDPSLIAMLNGERGEDGDAGNTGLIKSFSFKDYEFDFASPTQPAEPLGGPVGETRVNPASRDSTSNLSRESVHEEIVPDIKVSVEDQMTVMEPNSLASDQAAAHNMPCSGLPKLSPTVLAIKQPGPTADETKSAAKMKQDSEDLDAELDELLSVDPVMKLPPVKTDNPTLAEDADGDELEDWLDSII